MQWLAKDHPEHPINQWRPIFAIIPIRFGDKWYWLERPPFEFRYQYCFGAGIFGTNYIKLYRHKERKEFQDRDPAHYDWEYGIAFRERLRD